MNPFKYGTVVEDRYFINREKEISRIKDHLQSGNNLILYAPRRYGKTSLIMTILNQLRKEDVKTVYLDFFQVYSLESFIQLYASKVMENYDSKVPKEYSLLDAIDLPKKLKNKNEKWAIVFDEFQEINRLNGEIIEKQFRSILQFHDEIGYIFMGSKTHMMLNMFADKRRAFYNIGKIQKLDKISSREMMDYIKREFEKGGFVLEGGILEKVLGYTENVPYYNQYLASEIWQVVREQRNNINEEIVEKAVTRILDNQGDYYYTLFDQLTGYQRSVLHAFLQERENIYSKEYTQKYGLSSVSSTQRAMKRLVELGIIEKVEDRYTFSDPFFPLYLRLRTFA
jgi:AAA+ ATPase superfamily predicted ATPase